MGFSYVSDSKESDSHTVSLWTMVVSSERLTLNWNVTVRSIATTSEDFDNKLDIITSASYSMTKKKFGSFLN